MLKIISNTSMNFIEITVPMTPTIVETQNKLMDLYEASV